MSKTLDKIRAIHNSISDRDLLVKFILGSPLDWDKVDYLESRRLYVSNYSHPLNSYWVSGGLEGLEINALIEVYERLNK